MYTRGINRFARTEVTCEVVSKKSGGAFEIQTLVAPCIFHFAALLRHRTTGAECRLGNYVRHLRFSEKNSKAETIEDGKRMQEPLQEIHLFEINISFL